MDIIFMNDYSATYVRVNKRACNGDIVGKIDGDVFHVDQSDDWLFDYEKNDPNCYARRMQRNGSVKLRREINPYA